MHPILQRLREVPVILKILCLAFEIVGLICIQISSAGILSSIAFTIATSIAFILTAILLVITMMTDDVYGVNLSSLQMYYSALVAVVFIVTASFIVITINPLILTAAIFGFLTATVYAVEAFLRYKERS